MATEVLGNLNPMSSDFTDEDWVWDKTNCSPEVRFSQDSEAAYFYVNPFLESCGTAGVRGTRGFRDGEHYWEITFLEPPTGSSVMVGVGTKDVVLHRDNYQFINMIGADKNSWGLSYKGTVWHDGKSRKFCEPFYESKTVIGVHLDLYRGALKFYLNGKSLGTAFTGLDKVGQELYPIISSTATNSELEVGKRACRYWSLQEKCCHTVVQCLRTKADVDALPLPPIIKQQLVDLK